MTLEFKKYSVEHFVRIYDDDLGSYIEMRPDRDGCDLVELRSIDSTGNEERQMVLTKESAILLAAEILLEYLTDKDFYIEFVKKLSKRIGVKG